MEFSMNHISESIRDFRRRTKTSLNELAKRSGVSRSMICQIENGSTIPTIAVLHKVSVAMGMPISRLVEAACVERVTIHRDDKANELRSPDGSFKGKVLTSLAPAAKIELIQFQFTKKGVVTLPGFVEGTHEFLRVYSGELWFVEPDGEHLLKPGEVLEYSAVKEHALLQKTTDYGLGTLTRFIPFH